MIKKGCCRNDFKNLLKTIKKCTESDKHLITKNLRDHFLKQVFNISLKSLIVKFFENSLEPRKNAPERSIYHYPHQYAMMHWLSI